jgi:hypothetical protein
MTELNTEYHYRAEVKSLAENMITETFEWLDDKSDMTRDECFDAVMDDINDHVLHETIDGHQWVIYYAYNLDVLKYSDNPDYMTDNFGDDSAGSILSEQGLNSLHSALAFWALYADVQDNLAAHGREYFDNYVESTEALAWD